MYGLGMGLKKLRAKSINKELVTNGDFATDSDWDKGSGWTITGGYADFNASSNSTLKQPFNTFVGQVYTVKLRTDGIVQGASSNIRIYLGGTFTTHSVPLGVKDIEYTTSATQSNSFGVEILALISGSVNFKIYIVSVKKD